MPSASTSHSSIPAPHGSGSGSEAFRGTTGAGCEVMKSNTRGTTGAGCTVQRGTTGAGCSVM